MMYFDRYGVEVKRMGEKKEARDGTSFKMMPFECSSNGMHGSFQWAKVRALRAKARRSHRRVPHPAPPPRAPPYAHACARQLRSRLDKIHAAVLADVETWRRSGAEQTQLLKDQHDAGVSRREAARATITPESSPRARARAATAVAP